MQCVRERNSFVFTVLGGGIRVHQRNTRKGRGVKEKFLRNWLKIAKAEIWGVDRQTVRVDFVFWDLKPLRENCCAENAGRIFTLESLDRIAAASGNLNPPTE